MFWLQHLATGKYFTSTNLKMTKTAGENLTSMCDHLRQDAPLQSCSSSDVTDAVNSAHPIAIELPAQGFNSSRLRCQSNRAHVLLSLQCPLKFTGDFASHGHRTQLSCVFLQPNLILSVIARKHCTSYLLFPSAGQHSILHLFCSSGCMHIYIHI